jgi:hypothetical protein
MKKKQLNEDMGIVLGMAVLGGLYFLAGKVFEKIAVAGLVGMSKVFGGGMIIPSKKAENALKNIKTNKQFILDFANIINDEGGFDEFIDKTVAKMDLGQDYNTSTIFNGYKSWADKNVQLGKGKTNQAVKVVDKLLNTKSFKSIIKKYDLDDREITYVGNVLYTQIISPNFRIEADKWILQSIKSKESQLKSQSKKESSTKLKDLIPNK